MSVAQTAALPNTFTTLVGREREVESIAAHLRNAPGSILTLVGPPGVGKTRLAIAVARRMADELEHGVVYVDLAALTDSAQVVPAIAGALGLAENDSAADRLTRYLVDRRLLLVI